MKNLVNPLPGYRVLQYMLVLNPHEDLRQRITQVKKEFRDKYKIETASYNTAQLTLATFTQYEIVEERITNRLKVIAMGYHPFKVELKDYGSFPTHSIYIQVTSKLPIQNLVKIVKTGVQALMKPDKENKPHFIDEPNIIVARKLQPWQYEKGWLEYSHRHFTGRFIADAMLLLKRPLGESRFTVAGRYEFPSVSQVDDL